MRRTSVAALLFAVTVPGCAREEPPPGTNPEQAPPVVRSLRPPDGESVPTLDGAARLRFNEPIQSPTTLVRRLVTSPAGDYDVSPNRTGLDVRPDDGWRQGVVYYFRLPAGVSDLLRNTTTEPIDWIFRIGAPVPQTEVTGRLLDRVTGRGTRGGTLVFLSSDSIRYTAPSDTGGVYRMPALPAGSYTVHGFVDQDRDYVYDAEFEPGGSEQFDLSDEERIGDVDVVMIPADSTPPIVVSARALDSTRVEVTFDDPLDDTVDPASVTITLRRAEGGPVPAIAEWAFGSLAAPEPEPIGDDEGENPDEAEEPDPAVLPQREAPFGEGPSLTGLAPAPTTLTVRFAEALGEGAYEIEVTGVANLRSLVGGGTVEFEIEAAQPAPPEADSEAEPEVDLDPDSESPEADPDAAPPDEPDEP